MIVTIDTDKKEILIEEATMNELYEYVAKFNLLNYTIKSKQSYVYTAPYVVEPFKKEPKEQKTNFNDDIAKAFKLYYNII